MKVLVKAEDEQEVLKVLGKVKYQTLSGVLSNIFQR